MLVGLGSGPILTGSPTVQSFCSRLKSSGCRKRNSSLVSMFSGALAGAASSAVRTAGIWKHKDIIKISKPYQRSERHCPRWLFDCHWILAMTTIIVTSLYRPYSILTLVPQHISTGCNAVRRDRAARLHINFGEPTGWCNSDQIGCSAAARPVEISAGLRAFQSTL